MMEHAIYSSFWIMAETSKEGDVLECEFPGYQDIVNNGDYAFMWEDSWKPVKLSGEFLGLGWRIK